MGYSVLVTSEGQRCIEKLDKVARLRVLSFLRDRLPKLEDPRSIGEALKGNKYGDLWKYRVGDYRIFAKIEDLRIVVLVLSVGHRREVYK
jgi:mRNA interferase RelE/StbE